jgi:hypothetical protein
MRPAHALCWFEPNIPCVSIKCQCTLPELHGASIRKQQTTWSDANAALQAFGRMFEPFMERWSKSYQAEVGGELRKYGLRVDDLLDPDWHPVRLPQLHQTRVLHWCYVCWSA